VSEWAGFNISINTL